MSSVRNLLTRGNRKLGENIFAWSLPAVVSCPGRSSLCAGVCYATAGYFRTSAVSHRLADNLQAAARPDFAARIIQEIRRRWVQVCRVHVAGDFLSAAYARAWVRIFRACPQTRFYAYTRSWRVPEIAPVLGQMAQLRNVRLWYSADRETGVPPSVPQGVRVAWLEDGEGHADPDADLVFVVRRLRRAASSRLELPLICPHETPQGREAEVTCTTCGRCWR
jgi:hypothetical protein